eukprot:23996-Pyramimonas_sp.AAC.2
MQKIKLCPRTRAEAGDRWRSAKSAAVMIMAIHYLIAQGSGFRRNEKLQTADRRKAGSVYGTCGLYMRVVYKPWLGTPVTNHSGIYDSQGLRSAGVSQ